MRTVNISLSLTNLNFDKYFKTSPLHCAATDASLARARCISGQFQDVKYFIMTILAHLSNEPAVTCKNAHNVTIQKCTRNTDF